MAAALRQHRAQQGGEGGDACGQHPHHCARAVPEGVVVVVVVVEREDARGEVRRERKRPARAVRRGTRGLEGVARGGDPLSLSIGRLSTTAMGRFVSLSILRR